MVKLRKIIRYSLIWMLALLHLQVFAKSIISDLDISTPEATINSFFANMQEENYASALYCLTRENQELLVSCITRLYFVPFDFGSTSSERIMDAVNDKKNFFGLATYAFDVLMDDLRRNEPPINLFTIGEITKTEAVKDHTVKVRYINCHTELVVVLKEVEDGIWKISRIEDELKKIKWPNNE